MPATGVLQIDRDAGLIRGVTIATADEARGHGFRFDAVSLQQLRDIIARKGGVPTRITHPTGDADGVLTQIGSVSNPYIAGSVLKGDLTLEKFAARVPIYGDVKSYLLDIAEASPTQMGLSVVISYTAEITNAGLPVARILDCEFADVVGQGAVTPRGLLSSTTNKIGKLSMTPEIKNVLVTDYGLSPDATDEQAQAFYDALSAEAKSACSTAATATPAPASMSVGNLDTAVLTERKRVNSIRALGTILPGLNADQVNAAITANLSVDDAKKTFLAALTTNCKPISHLHVGNDNNRASLSTACAQAIAIRGGTKIEKPIERVHQFAGMSVLEMGRRFYEAQGIDLSGIGRTQLARMLTNPKAAPSNVRSQRASLAQSTDDFDNVLSSTFNISLRQGYTEAPQKWPMWAKRGSLPDFTTGERPMLSAIGTPVFTNEGGEVQFTNLTDKKETITLATYKRGVAVTWQAVINDRLNAFNAIFAKMGAACRRLEDDLAFVPLTTASFTGQTMTEDSVVLFHTSHSNIVSATGSAGAPTVTTLSAARVKLALQTGMKGETLGLEPGAILVPVELATVTEQLIASLVDPTKSNDTTNPAWIRNLTVVSDARLSTASTTAWVLAASPAAIDGVEVAFLDDEPAPVTDFEVDFDTDDQRYKVRHSVGARALDYRAFVKNNGA
jgi:hypothetical protein